MPPTSIDILLADELVAALNETFASAFTAERVYVPDWSAKTELATLQVGVWPENPEASADYERTRLQKRFPIAVAFAQRLTEKTRDEIDALCDLVMSVADYLELQSVTTDVGDHRLLNEGWEFRSRFLIDLLDRTKKPDDSIAYTGTFASVLSFPFVLLD